MDLESRPSPSLH